MAKKFDCLLKLGLTIEEARKLLSITEGMVAGRLKIPVADFGAEEHDMAMEIARARAEIQESARKFLASPLTAREYVKEMMTSAGVSPGIIDPQHVIHHVKKRRKKRLKTKKSSPYIMGMWPSGFAEVPATDGGDAGNGGE